MTDDEVVEAIRALAEAGEYRDRLPALRMWLGGGAPLDRPEGSVQPAESLRPVQPLPRRRHYARGSAEHVAARESGQVDPLPPLTTAEPEALDAAEESLGFPLPGLLRRLYLEVGNGGFGPGGGVLGVSGGLGYGDWNDIVEVNSVFRADAQNPAPAGLVWFHHWGRGIWSLIDCRDPEGWMWGWDPQHGTDGTLFPERLTITDWFAGWLAGELRSPQPPEDSA